MSQKYVDMEFTGVFKSSLCVFVASWMLVIINQLVKAKRKKVSLLYLKYVIRLGMIICRKISGSFDDGLFHCARVEDHQSSEKVI